MTSFPDVPPDPVGDAATSEDVLRRAVGSYLAGYTGQSRAHTNSDLRRYLTWCAARNFDPLMAGRLHVELYVRWMQEVRRYQPSTVSRRLSVVVCFYRTCLLGLLGLRIFEATGASIADLGEEHGHRVLKVHGKGDKTALVPLPPAVARAIDRSVGDRAAGPILLNTHGTGMDRQAATRRLRHLAQAAGLKLPRMHPHMLRHTFVTTMLDAGVDLRDVQIAARHADPRTTMRYDRARTNLDRHPNYTLAAYMASGT